MDKHTQLKIGVPVSVVGLVFGIFIACFAYKNRKKSLKQRRKKADEIHDRFTYGRNVSSSFQGSSVRSQTSGLFDQRTNIHQWINLGNFPHAEESIIHPDYSYADESSIHSIDPDYSSTENLSILPDYNSGEECETVIGDHSQQGRHSFHINNLTETIGRQETAMGKKKLFTTFTNQNFVEVPPDYD